MWRDRVRRGDRSLTDRNQNRTQIWKTQPRRAHSIPAQEPQKKKKRKTTRELEFSSSLPFPSSRRTNAEEGARPPARVCRTPAAEQLAPECWEGRLARRRRHAAVGARRPRDERVAHRARLVPQPRDLRHPQPRPLVSVSSSPPLFSFRV